jgi:CRISPR/Cas system endoribonuclease Cas6 (RAMP superfamily)
LRLKYLNELESGLPFHVLIRAALRRISSLFTAYGDGEPDLDYRGIVRRAQEITIEKSALHWFDWRRWSNRQDQGMLMGGLMGSITYAGALTEFMPLLLLCETLHLGKQTAFGLGKIKIYIDGGS